METEFGVDCYVNPDREILTEKRYFKIETLKNDFVDIIVSDSENKSDCHIFSFGVSHITQELQKKVSKGIEILSLAENFFNGYDLGLVLNDEDSIVHINKGLTKDVSHYINLKYIGGTKMNEIRLKLNKVIFGQKVLDCYLSQKYGEEKTEGELLVRKGKGFTLIYFNRKLPDIEIDHVSSLLTECSKNEKFKNIL